MPIKDIASDKINQAPALWCVSQNVVVLYSGQNFVTNGVRNWAKDSLSSV